VRVRVWARSAIAVPVLAAALIGGSAGDAATAGQAARGAADVRLAGGDGHLTIARLEAKASKLARQYRGELNTLAGAETDAKAAAERAAMVRHQLVISRHKMAKLAVASYLTGGANRSLMELFSGHTRGILGRSAIISYLAKQRSARQRVLRQLMAATRRADHEAAAKISELRKMIAALEKQRQTVKHLLAKFHPESPVIGGTITPRMAQVKNAVDRRFGPFSAIGCYRPEATGEHPLGRACDFMLSTGGVMPTAANVQLGYAIAHWAQANASRLGIMYIIYRQHIWDIRIASEGWVAMPDRGSITANHYDHVHISVF
jgi:peptidoglycan DL-endopeptidase CwlO